MNFKKNNERIHWRKDLWRSYYIALAVVVGFAMFFAVAFLIPHGRGIRFQLFVFSGYAVYLLIVLIVIRFERYIPRRYGISEEELRFQYRKKLETYRWNEISRIYSKKTQGSTKLAIESRDGEVTLIPFLVKSDRERIINYYENQKELNKPQ